MVESSPKRQFSKTSKKGFLITIEGIDKVGKTTQKRNIVKYLRDLKQEAVPLFEPGNTYLGEEIKRLILFSKIDVCNEAELFLYMADRSQHFLEKIQPALKAGYIVVMDRFVDSTIAYQGYGRGFNVELIKVLNKYIIEGYEPDLTFLLDIPINKMLEIKSESFSYDSIERENDSFHINVCNGYRKLALQNPTRIKTIKYNEDEKVVFNQIKKHLHNFFK